MDLVFHQLRLGNISIFCSTGSSLLLLKHFSHCLCEWVVFFFRFYAWHTRFAAESVCIHAKPFTMKLNKWSHFKTVSLIVRMALIHSKSRTAEINMIHFAWFITSMPLASAWTWTQIHTLSRGHRNSFAWQFLIQLVFTVFKFFLFLVQHKINFCD